MKYLYGLSLSLLGVFAPIKALIVVATLLILIDAITGVLASRKEGRSITSAGFRRTVSKLFSYNGAIALCFLVEAFMIDGYFPLSKIAAAAVGITELKSVLENIDKLNGNPIFKAIIEKLGSINDTKSSEDKKDGE